MYPAPPVTRMRMSTGVLSSKWSCERQAGRVGRGLGDLLGLCLAHTTVKIDVRIAAVACQGCVEPVRSDDVDPEKDGGQEEEEQEHERDDPVGNANGTVMAERDSFVLTPIQLLGRLRDE